jgi:NAD(P)H-hydrate epimerase
MSELPVHIHSVQQVRAMDRYAIDRLGIPGYTLMTRAGEAALDDLHKEWPQARRILVVCGFGNNAGDGYVVARLATAAGLSVSVIALGDPDKLTGDAARAWYDFKTNGGQALAWDDVLLDSADVVVDAIFGTGLARPLSAELIERVNAISAAPCPVFALDVPSGLNADSGEVLGAAVRAHRTISFVGLKQGFYLGAGPNCTGALAFAGLGIPAAAVEAVGFTCNRLTSIDVERALPRRERTAHKGDVGRVLLVGSNAGMAGAIRMTGEACLRVGAGLVTVATRAENVAAVVTARPELMCRGIEAEEELDKLIDWASVVAIGPGLGQDKWSHMALTRVLRTAKPLVIDADALNMVAANPLRRGNWILTPHPGEAARLLSTTTADVQRDRIGAARALVQRFGGTVILKGAGSIVLDATELPTICDRGNPGMATPGMGDVLTGVVAGIAAQTQSLLAAAKAAVFVHASAGDLAAKAGGERGLIATDLFPHLRACVNP